MNKLIERLAGMGALTDEVIATDMLVASKSAIKQYALAITETATPEVRKTLMDHLDDCVAFHKKLSNYMMDKEYYEPFDTDKQFQMDSGAAERVLNQAD